MLVATCASLLAFTSCHPKKSADEAQLLSVDVAFPQVDSVTIYRTYPATAAAGASADIVARVNGMLLSRNYTPGSAVKKGQVLFTIDPTRYHDAVEQSRASLATARNEYIYASNQAEAMRKALESDAVSKLDVIQAESNMAQAAAAIENAEAALNLSLTDLGYCTVRAPFDGHISSSLLDPGAYVAGGTSPVTLAKLYDDAYITVVFSISDAQFGQIFDGENAPQNDVYRRVPLSFDTPLTHSYTGDLTYTAPSIDTSTGTITLKCRVENPYGELRDGMYVTVHLPYDTAPHAILVKDNALGTDQLGKYLYTLTDSNRVVYTPVTVGDLYCDTLRIVTHGITPQTRYVTSALLKVRDGMHVIPTLK
jgi:RND family efflux transporter MFP subunit